jgi:hypothetical protein
MKRSLKAVLLAVPLLLVAVLSACGSGGFGMRENPSSYSSWCESTEAYLAAHDEGKEEVASEELEEMVEFAKNQRDEANREALTEMVDSAENGDVAPLRDEVEINC